MRVPRRCERSEAIPWLWLFISFWITFSLFADTPYFCPMKCEGEKTYTKPGTCPVCGMNLEKKGIDSAVSPLNSRVYRADFQANPKALEAGKKTEFNFWVRKTSDNSNVPLEPIFQEPLQLFIVKQDLSEFIHAHPKERVEGGFQDRIVFPSGGNYILYLQAKPANGTTQIFPIAIQVQGAKPKEKPLQVTEKKVFRAGKPFSLDFDAGLSTKDPNVFGDLIAVSEDTVDFYYSHSKGGTNFPMNLSRPGLYKVWIELPLNRKLHTFERVLRITN